MLVLITYDVATTTPQGRKRLSHIAKVCLNYGQRVQNSVFECEVTPGQWAAMKYELENIYDPQEDSLRFYYLGKNWKKRIEHVGTKPAIDMSGPLII